MNEIDLLKSIEDEAFVGSNNLQIFKELMEDSFKKSISTLSDEINILRSEIESIRSTVSNIKVIRGPQGPAGPAGPTGPRGKNGNSWKPTVDEEGNISWRLDDTTILPTPQNIRGPKGVAGESQVVVNRIPTFKISGKTLQYKFDDESVYRDIGDVVGEDGAPGLDGKTPKLKWNGTKLQIAADGETFDDGIELRGPQGLQGLKGLDGINGKDGINGDTWVPSVSDEGVISWSKNTGVTSIASKNIKGPQGLQGLKGLDGINGKDGINGDTWVPSVDEEGVISWSKNTGVTSIDSRNIRGPQGATGLKGVAGDTWVPSVSSDGEISWTKNTGATFINPVKFNFSNVGDMQKPGASI